MQGITTINQNLTFSWDEQRNRIQINHGDGMISMTYDVARNLYRLMKVLFADTMYPEVK